MLVSGVLPGNSFLRTLSPLHGVAMNENRHRHSVYTHTDT